MTLYFLLDFNEAYKYVANMEIVYPEGEIYTFEHSM